MAPLESTGMSDVDGRRVADEAVAIGACEDEAAAEAAEDA